ncbi:OmpA family protein [Pseudophaeobacter arcticus]|jgi:OOP family OmpA-OmpF porin|uniref:OmpA family protein n=1 Tax=Pseudophaeobacter arcticus TaxID=385492 RepID=UPI0039E54274
MRLGLAVLALGGCLSLAVSSVSAQAQPGAAVSLQLPDGATARSKRETAMGTYALPVGPFSAAGIPLRLKEGHILRRTWHLQSDATVLQVLDVLRRQLVEQGYEILFQCETRQCGGFDFRFGIEVVPAPDMVVSLSDYHFLAAQKPASSVTGAEAADAAEATQVVSLLVSRSGTVTYMQLIEVTPEKQAPLALVTSETSPPALPLQGQTQTASGLEKLLEQQGHVVLDGVAFGTGGEALGQEAIASLERLAGFLDEAPKAQVLIVGHTDSVGGLEDNKSLSLRRAQVVKETLVQAYGVAEARIAVAGAGYMAPIASNLTAAGREQNRRVEVVLLSR